MLNGNGASQKEPAAGRAMDEADEEAKMAKAYPVMTPSEEEFRTKWDFKQTPLLAKGRLSLDSLMIELSEDFLRQRL